VAIHHTRQGLALSGPDHRGRAGHLAQSEVWADHPADAAHSGAAAEIPGRTRTVTLEMTCFVVYCRRPSRGDMVTSPTPSILLAMGGGHRVLQPSRAALSWGCVTNPSRSSGLRPWSPGRKAGALNGKPAQSDSYRVLTRTHTINGNRAGPPGTRACGRRTIAQVTSPLRSRKPPRSTPPEDDGLSYCVLRKAPLAHQAKAVRCV
jgi:hypothetical protein